MCERLKKGIRKESVSDFLTHTHTHHSICREKMVVSLDSFLTFFSALSLFVGLVVTFPYLLIQLFHTSIVVGI